MSAQAVLFDAPGPRARRRHRVIGAVGVLALLALVGIVAWGLRAQLTGPLWKPFLQPITWSTLR